MLFGRTSWQRPQPQLTTSTTTITTTTATTSGSWDGLHNELRKKNLQNPPSHTAILGLDFGWRKSWQKGAQDYQVMFAIVWKKNIRQSEIFGEPRLNDFFWELFDPWPMAITILDTTSLQKNTWVKSQNGCLIGPLWSSHQPESERQGRHGFSRTVFVEQKNPTKISKQVQEILTRIKQK